MLYDQLMNKALLWYQQVEKKCKNFIWVLWFSKKFPWVLQVFPDFLTFPFFLIFRFSLSAVNPGELRRCIRNRKAAGSNLTKPSA